MTRRRKKGHVVFGKGSICGFLQAQMTLQLPSPLSFADTNISKPHVALLLPGLVLPTCD